MKEGDLCWNGRRLREDLPARWFMQGNEHYKVSDIPIANYRRRPRSTKSNDGRQVGRSLHVRGGDSYNERSAAVPGGRRRQHNVGDVLDVGVGRGRAGGYAPKTTGGGGGG